MGTFLPDFSGKGGSISGNCDTDLLLASGGEGADEGVPERALPGEARGEAEVRRALRSAAASGRQTAWRQGIPVNTIVTTTCDHIL